MKILHTADWHLGAYVGPQCDSPGERMENTRKCLKTLIDTAQRERPDIILVAGDIFHQARVWSDRALVEVRVAAGYLDSLAQWAPVVVLYGTPNHDGEQQFKALMQMTGTEVHYFMSPEIKTFKTGSGPIQVAGLPGFDKGHFRAQFPGLSAEEENQVFSQQLDTIIQGLSAQLDPAIPSVFMAHHTVVGCELDNGTHIFQANDVVLSVNTLDSSDFDLVCLGHIHKRQRVVNSSKPIYYAGSIDSFTFNDEGHLKGFFIHYIREGGGYVSSHNFRELPSREFCTERLSQDDIKSQSWIDRNYSDKVVRILYTCDSETEKALNKKELERDLYAAGAYYVSEIRPEKIETSVNQERINEKLTVWDCLLNYLREKKIDTAEIDRLFTEASPIISAVEATTLAGGQTGLFLPLEIEVRNYRSYAEEKLSFQDIYFAMVNGRNGSGKSSLFMDALVDCLYEQPREGELTGWIRNGEKSGSISFTFQLGEDLCRVTRTRQRSGKATLALAKLVRLGNSDWDSSQPAYEEFWKDHSCERMNDTQKKIVDLLGMDADTFRSCVLIMQDQYGRFMEAKPEDRMSVLANILGLGIYEQLENETKSTLTVVNRDLKTAKEKVSILEEETSQIGALQSNLNNIKEQLKTLEGILFLLKQKRDEATIKVATLEQAKKERDRLIQESTTKEQTAKEKSNKLEQMVKDAAETNEFLKGEELLNQKHLELQNITERIASMTGSLNLLQDKKKHMDKLQRESSALIDEGSKLKNDIQKINDKLDGYDALAEKIQSLERSEERLEEWENKAVQHDNIIKSKQKDDSSYSSDMQLNTYKTQQLKVKATTLNKKIDMLNNSGCIDVKQAKCKFLADAVTAEAEKAEIENEIRSAEDFIAAREKSYKGICEAYEKQLKELGYNDVLHRKAKVDLQDHNKLKQQIISLDGDKKLVDAYTERLSKIKEDAHALIEEIKRLKPEISLLQQEVSDYSFLQIKATELTEYEEQLQQIPVAKNYLENLLPQIGELEKEITDLSIKSKADWEKASEFSLQVQDFERNREDLQGLEHSISDYEQSANYCNKQIGSLEEKISVLEDKAQECKQLQEKVSELAGKASRLQVLTEAFGQDGIPHQIVRDIIPELENSANEILTQMTGGRMRLEFRTERTLKSNKAKEIATLDIVIIDVDNGELPYLSRSGGQKVRAALAVSFALAMVKASRVGLQLGMMFVDEPPFLDAEGIEAYCMALESIHERYPEMRIVAISHDENMKARFPQQITVVETDNGSKLRRA